MAANNISISKLYKQAYSILKKAEPFQAPVPMEAPKTDQAEAEVADKVIKDWGANKVTATIPQDDAGDALYNSIKGKNTNISIGKGLTRITFSGPNQAFVNHLNAKVAGPMLADLKAAFAAAKINPNNYSADNVVWGPW